MHHLRATHVGGVCKRIELTSLRDAFKDFGIPNVGQLFHAHIEEDWGHEVCGLVLGYDPTVLIDSIFMKLQNGLLYNHQPFHCPTSVECLEHDSKVEYTNTNRPESDDIRVQHMEGEENDLDNTTKAEFPLFRTDSVARVNQITSCKFPSTCEPQKWYRPFWWAA